MASWASPLTSGLATTIGRIEFAKLRTDCSLPVALHLLLRERSYFQLMVSDQDHEGTFTLLIKQHHRRTGRTLRRSVLLFFSLQKQPTDGAFGHTVRRLRRRCAETMERNWTTTNRRGETPFFTASLTVRGCPGRDRSFELNGRRFRCVLGSQIFFHSMNWPTTSDYHPRVRVDSHDPSSAELNPVASQLDRHLFVRLAGSLTSVLAIHFNRLAKRFT